jgi:hypothetical protein
MYPFLGGLLTTRATAAVAEAPSAEAERRKV